MGFEAEIVSQRVSIDQVEEALIGAHELWRRSPGGGTWPFAGDGPWHLAQPEVGDIAGDYSETLLHTDAGKELRVRKVETRAPRGALDAAEVAERDRVTAWLELLADPVERALVWAGTEALARGEGRVPWSAIKPRLGWTKGLDALAWRYKRALATIAGRLNGWTERRIKAEATRWVRASDGE